MKSGFTILELILATALFLFLGTLATAFYSRVYVQSTVASTTDQLTQALRKAQTYAMSSRQNGNWGIHLGSSQVTLFQGSTYVSRATAFDESFAIGSNATISAFPDIIFTRLTGTPSSTATINITGGTNSKTVTINSQGVVSR